MAYGDLINEDRLFELYDIMLAYASDSERETLAQHIYDWLRAWEAPSSVFEGMMDHDKFLAEISRENGFRDSHDDEEEDYQDEEDLDWDD